MRINICQTYMNFEEPNFGGGVGDLTRMASVTTKASLIPLWQAAA